MTPWIGVLGAGSWGTALADLLAREGHRVRLWAWESEVVESINQDRENVLYFPGCTLASELTAVSDPLQVVDGASMVVVATPSHVTRKVLRQVARGWTAGVPLVCASKGIEMETLALMSDVAQAEVPVAPFVALSGPSFAREVFDAQPTAVVAASAEAAVARRVQEAFSCERFRVYTSGDVIGTELGGSLKNVIAIAAGILEGLGLGNNPRAALITRGLAEMRRLGTALGADAATFAGLAGIGDLILTTCGSLSRNRSLGVALAQGQTLEEHRATHRTVAEGVNTAEAASRLAERADVELPITNEVRAVLFEGKSPRDAIADLMTRELRPERDA